MGEERRARVLGLGCSNSDGVSSYGTKAMRGNILLTFGGGDGRGWSGNGGAVETKLCVGEWLLRRFSIQGEGQASTGVAWRCFSTGQRSSKWIGVAVDRGEDLRRRLGLVDQFAREELLFIGGNPSTRNGRGDDLDSISNLKQTRRIATDFGKGINSVWKTLCGYERCRVWLRLLAGWTGSVKDGVGWAVLGCAALRANGRPASTGPRWATSEWGGKREWLLGRARPPVGFRPTVSLVFKIPFLFPNLFIICKII
jgi:hypothetical protein